MNLVSELASLHNGSLMRDAKEIEEYSRVSFQNRPNMVATKMMSVVEHHRRLGHICERGKAVQLDIVLTLC